VTELEREMRAKAEAFVSLGADKCVEYEYDDAVSILKLLDALAAAREGRDIFLRQRNKYASLYFETQTELEKALSPCPHQNTEIIEPHLAGARRCLDCGAERGAGSLPYERSNR